MDFGLSIFEERVKEASSSEVPQKARDQCVHIVILCKGLVVSYAITPRKCDIVPDQHICVVAFKVHWNFYANYGESVQHL